MSEVMSEIMSEVLSIIILIKNNKYFNNILFIKFKKINNFPNKLNK